MITDAILNLTFGIFGFIFDFLPLPSTPTFLAQAMQFIAYWVGKGCSLVTWIFPAEIYHETISIILSCMIVRFSYDLYIKFHHFKSTN